MIGFFIQIVLLCFGGFLIYFFGTLGIFVGLPIVLLACLNEPDDFEFFKKQESSD